MPVALAAAAGYALLELAFFASRNQILPWQPGHVVLGLIFFALHLAVALVALGVVKLAARRIRALGGPFAAFAPLAALAAIQGISFFRERLYGLPRDLAGTAGTLVFAALPFAAAAILAWTLRARPRAAERTALALAFAVVLAGLVRVATARAPEPVAAVMPRAATHRLAARDTGQRVLVFGFDGGTWTILQPMLDAGRLPNLAALVARGRTFDVETIRPTFSPVIWTSIATGKSRFRHGIHDVVQTVLPGGVKLPRAIERTAFYTKTTGVLFRALDRRHAFPLVPYRSEQVKATSVFEAASEAGIPTTEIEWYVSHPARPLSGVCVSDRFHLQARDRRLEGATYPAALDSLLAGEIVRADDVPVERVLSFIDASGLDADGAAAWAKKHAKFVTEMQLNLARDLTTRNVSVDLLSRDADWRLFATYFRAVDLSHHLTWRLRKEPGDVAQDPDLRLRPVIERYYELMDSIVGEVLAAAPPQATLLVLSDHGFEDRYAHSRAPDGFAILAGGATVPSPSRGRLSIYDVAPTIAALLGLPVAQDLDGRVRADLLDPALLASFPVKEVSTWEREGRPQAGTTSSAEPEGAVDSEVERLRALGYIH
ncbi:MAG: alkaline phosphatase family protein [bacterium]